jgi:hypothetical protein
MRVVSTANHTHVQLEALGHTKHLAALSGVNKSSIFFFSL